MTDTLKQLLNKSSILPKSNWPKKTCTTIIYISLKTTSNKISSLILEKNITGLRKKYALKLSMENVFSAKILIGLTGRSLEKMKANFRKDKHVLTKVLLPITIIGKTNLGLAQFLANIYIYIGQELHAFS